MLPSGGLVWESFGKNQLGPEVRAPAAKDRQDEKINRVTKSGNFSSSDLIERERVHQNRPAAVKRNWPPGLSSDWQVAFSPPAIMMADESFHAHYKPNLAKIKVAKIIMIKNGSKFIVNYS